MSEGNDKLRRGDAAQLRIETGLYVFEARSDDVWLGRREESAVGESGG